jgi:hypothetical protein
VLQVNTKEHGMSLSTKQLIGDGLMIENPDIKVTQLESEEEGKTVVRKFCELLLRARQKYGDLQDDRELLTGNDVKTSSRNRSDRVRF